MTDWTQDDSEASAPFNAGDRSQVRERDREIKQDAKDRDKFLQAMLDTFEGRQWFGHLLFEKLGLFIPDSPARGVAIGIHKDALRISPDQYMVCMRENRHKM